MRHSAIVAVLFASTVLSIAPSRGVLADEPAPDGKKPTVDERLEDLDQRQRIVERKLELHQESSDEKAKTAAVPTANPGGFSLGSGNGAFTLRFSGVVQADGRFFVNDRSDRLTDNFLINKARLVFEGTVFDFLDFRIMPDFGQGQTVLQEAYSEFKYWSFARLQAGKFKEPVGLERQQKDTNTLFVERGLPTGVAPNRDVGVQLNGDLLDGVLSYSLGVFDGVQDGGSTDNDTNDDKDIAGRVFVRPLAKSKMPLFEGLGLGVAGNWGEETGATPSYKTAAQNTFFSYVAGVVPSGKRDRISPQAYWSIGPFGLLTEYIVSSGQYAKGAIEVVEDVQAWQVAGSFLLTGEKASFNGVTPKNNFDPRNGSWGAFEVAARYDEQRLDLGAFDQGLADRKASAHRVRDFVVGLNWYLNRSLKVQVDYARSIFAGGAARGDREPENAILARIQLYF